MQKTFLKGINEEQQKEIFRRIAKKYGKQLAQILEQNDLLHPQIQKMITYFNHGRVNLDAVRFLKQFFGKRMHESENQEKLILESLAWADTPEEKKINQYLSQCLKEKKYEAFVRGLFEKAGYDIIIADTLEKQNSIQEYFLPEEQLCTFHDENRYKRFYIIHAVKKNAKLIPRSQHPSRQDAYGTSVISIQISKNGFFISIKNRYNHTVIGCDNTFNSNPDNIIFGLSEGIKRLFNVEFENIEVPKGFVFIDSTYLIPYHKEADGFYFCQKGYLKGNVMFEIYPDYQCVIEDVVLDKRKGIAFSPIDSGFAQMMNQEMQGKKIQERKLSNGRRVLFLNKQHFMTIKEGRVEKLTLRRVKKLPAKALYRLEKLTSFVAYELREMEEKNIYACINLKKIKLPKVQKVGIWNFCDCKADIFLPRLMEADICAFRYCKGKIYLPKLQENGLNSFYSCSGEICLPSLEKAGQDCFFGCQKRIYAPKLKKIQWNSFRECQGDLILDNALQASDSCFLLCGGKIQAPKLKSIGKFCFYKCTQEIHLPSLEDCGKDCFVYTVSNMPCKIAFQPFKTKNIRQYE